MRPDFKEVLDWVTYLGMIEDDNEVTGELVIEEEEEEEVHIVELSMESQESTGANDEGA